VEIIEARFADHPISFSVSPDQRKLLAAEARAAVMELGGVCDTVSAG